MSLYVDHCVSLGAKILYMCDELSGTTAADDSGNSHPGTISGSGITYREPGPSQAIPYAFKFDGSVGRITLANHTDIQVGDGPFTLQWWMKLNNPMNVGNEVIMAKSTDINPGYQVYRLTTQALTLADGDGTQNINTFDTFSERSWYSGHVTRKSAADGNWYINGRETTTSSNILTYTNDTADLIIGDDSVVHPFNGWLTGIAIYKTELTAAQIGLNVSIGFGAELSGITREGRI